MYFLLLVSWSPSLSQVTTGLGFPKAVQVRVMLPPSLASTYCGGVSVNVGGAERETKHRQVEPFIFNTRLGSRGDSVRLAVKWCSHREQDLPASLHQRDCSLQHWRYEGKQVNEFALENIPIVTECLRAMYFQVKAEYVTSAHFFTFDCVDCVWGRFQNPWMWENVGNEADTLNGYFCAFKGV